MKETSSYTLLFTAPLAMEVIVIPDLPMCRTARTDCSRVDGLKKRNGPKLPSPVLPIPTELDFSPGSHRYPPRASPLFFAFSCVLSA